MSDLEDALEELTDKTQEWDALLSASAGDFATARTTMSTSIMAALAADVPTGAAMVLVDIHAKFQERRLELRPLLYCAKGAEATALLSEYPNALAVIDKT